MKEKNRKLKLGKTKPNSQLLLFSNQLSDKIEIYFSGSVVIEYELETYGFKYHEEAKHAVKFMKTHCKTLGIAPYRFMTVVINFKPSGLTLASLTGVYEYSVAIAGRKSCEQLQVLHNTYSLLEKRLKAFEVYESHTTYFCGLASNEPIKLSKRSVDSINKQLKKTSDSIVKSMRDIEEIFRKKYQPSYK